jgi:RimJ/RimL family protein N-acetyltransferase
MSFELQPTLRGRLVHLRPLVEADFESLFRVASDPLIWEQHPDKSRCQLDGFTRFFRSGIESGGALLATDLATGETIGASRYHGYDETASEVEIGWTFLARRCWGGTYNRDMKRLMVEHAFRFVDRVVFMIAPENVRSQQAVGRIGALRDGGPVTRDGFEHYRYVLTPVLWAASGPECPDL